MPCDDACVTEDIVVDDIELELWIEVDWLITADDCDAPPPPVGPQFNPFDGGVGTLPLTADT